MKATITRREIVWVLLGAVVVAGLTMLPYIRAVQLTPTRHQFAGFISAVDDGNAYLSWIRQASEGRWLLRNPYTIKAQNPHFFNILLVLLGKICAATGLAPIIVFHAARLVASVFMLYAFYGLISEITEDRRIRATAFLLVSVSSGLGWIVYLQVRLAGEPLVARYSLHPPDVAAGWQVQPEGFTFLAMLMHPLFVTAMALLCVLFKWGLRATRQPDLRSTVVCGLLLLVLGNVHTYDVVVAYPVLAAWFALAATRGDLSWRQAAGRYGLIALLGLPGPLWAAYTTHVDPAYRAKIMQNPTLSAEPADYVVGYGLVGLLAVVGAVYVVVSSRRSRVRAASQATSTGPLLVVVWAVLGFALLYLPVPFQRKLIEGLHLPLCVLAALGLNEVLAPVVRRWLSRPTVIAVAVLVTIPSNVLFVADCLQHVEQNNRDLLGYLVPPVYLTDDEVAALRWLADNTSEADTVLSSSLIGNHIPAHAPCTVVAGHWAETLQYGRALGHVKDFYSSGHIPSRQRQILGLTGSTVVFYGPQERMLQSATAPRGAEEGSPAMAEPGVSLPELKVAFARGGVRIYRVIAPAEATGMLH